MSDPKTQEELDSQIPFDDAAGSTPTESALDPVTPSPAVAPAASADPPTIGESITAPTRIEPIC